MEQKSIITGVLVVLCIILIYIVFFQEQNVSISDILKDQASGAQFASAFVASNTVYLVQDLVNANASVRKNIQQCGIDFAGSPGLATKDQKIYAFEGGQCYGFDSSKSTTINKCLLEIKNQPEAVVFYIRQGFESKFYTRGILVGLGKDYTRGDCNVNFLNPTKSKTVSGQDLPTSDIISQIAAEVVGNNTNVTNSTATITTQNKSK
jgi:hypothetical protein